MQSVSTDSSLSLRSRLSLVILLLLVAALAVTPVLDQRAAQNYESLFQRALVTFALARTLNGVISAVQGTEVALQPAGVGVTLTPGELLDPVNDLVERFSWLMLGATVSLGVQQVLLELSAYWLVQLTVAVLCLWLLALYVAKRSCGGLTRSTLWRLLLIAMFLRFAVPITLLANELVYDTFLASRYAESTEVIMAAEQELEAMGGDPIEQLPAPEAETGWFEGLSEAFSDTMDAATDGLQLAERVAAVQARAAEMIEHLIQLSVVFVLQTGILPVAFLWLFLQLGRWVLQLKP